VGGARAELAARLQALLWRLTDDPGAPDDGGGGGSADLAAASDEEIFEALDKEFGELGEFGSADTEETR
jgi:hypothetical protein